MGNMYEIMKYGWNHEICDFRNNSNLEIHWSRRRLKITYKDCNYRKCQKIMNHAPKIRSHEVGVGIIKFINFAPKPTIIICFKLSMNIAN